MFSSLCFKTEHAFSYSLGSDPNSTHQNQYCVSLEPHTHIDWILSTAAQRLGTPDLDYSLKMDTIQLGKTGLICLSYLRVFFIM